MPTAGFRESGSTQPQPHASSPEAARFQVSGVISTVFFKAFERRSFSTDYMEWNLQSSVRLRGVMIVNESDEAQPRHHNEQPDQDPGHRRPDVKQEGVAGY